MMLLERSPTGFEAYTARPFVAGIRQVQTSPWATRMTLDKGVKNPAATYRFRERANDRRPKPERETPPRGAS